MSQTISLHLPDALVSQLDAVAATEDRSRSATARRLLQNALKPYEFAVGGIHAIHFETLHTPVDWLDIAVASLGALPPEVFTPPDNTTALKAARWVAQRYESRTAFEDRIRADLKAEGTFGVQVTIYEHPSFWDRNQQGKTFIVPGGGHPYEGKP